MWDQGFPRTPEEREALVPHQHLPVERPAFNPEWRPEKPPVRL